MWRSSVCREKRRESTDELSRPRKVCWIASQWSVSENKSKIAHTKIYQWSDGRNTSGRHRCRTSNTHNNDACQVSTGDTAYCIVPEVWHWKHFCWYICTRIFLVHHTARVQAYCNLLTTTNLGIHTVSKVLAFKCCKARFYITSASAFTQRFPPVTMWTSKMDNLFEYFLILSSRFQQAWSVTNPMQKEQPVQAE